jgi:hypothetical protein
MTQQMLEGITQIILSLKPSERRKLWGHLIRTRALSEDEADILLIETRRAEPSRPYSEIRKELIRKGRLR